MLACVHHADVLRSSSSLQFMLDNAELVFTSTAYYCYYAAEHLYASK